MRAIRLKELYHIVPLSKAQIDRMESHGKFPKRIQLSGPKAVAWLESEVNDWLQDRAAQRDTVTIRL